MSSHSVNIYRVASNGIHRGELLATVKHVDSVMSHGAVVSFWFNGTDLDVTLETWQDYSVSDSLNGCMVSFFDNR